MKFSTGKIVANNSKVNIPDLTNREHDILYFINNFGFCEIKHIMEALLITRSIAYAQMQILSRLGFVTHAYILPNRPGVYFLTQKGVRMAQLNLPPISRISTITYLHQLTVIKVFLKIKNMLPAGMWLTERHLLQEKQEKNAEKLHLPDGVLKLTDGTHIAVEVELSLKNRTRLEDILTDYAIDQTYQEVWYFCSASITKVLNEMAINIPKIKTHLMEENV